MDDLKAFGTIAATAATAAAVLGSEIVVATTAATVAAPGIAGFLGFTTIATSVVALPVVGGVTVIGLAIWGLNKLVKD